MLFRSVQALEKKIVNLMDVITKQKVEMLSQNNCLTKLIDFIEDCYKVTKTQTAKLELYEYTEKWAQQLTTGDLTSLAAHFKEKLDSIQDLINKNSKGRQPTKTTPKLELKLKHNEQYIINLLKEAKAISHIKPKSYDINDTQLNPILDEVPNNKLFDLIQSIKDFLIKGSPLPSNEKFNEEFIDWLSEQNNKQIWYNIKIQCPRCLVTSKISNST